MTFAFLFVYSIVNNGVINMDAHAIFQTIGKLTGKAGVVLKKLYQKVSPYVEEGIHTAGVAIKEGYKVAQEVCSELKTYIQSDKFKEDAKIVMKQASDTFEQILKQLEEKVKTNNVARALAIKKVTFSINKLDPNNTKKIDNLGKIIDSFELCNPEYGAIINKEDLQKFADILNQNPEYSEESKKFDEMLSKYPETESKENNHSPESKNIKVQNHETAREEPEPEALGLAME